MADLETNRAPRHDVTIFITAGDDMLPFGRTRDLSVSGAFIETTARPDVGSTQEFAIVWGEDTLVCPARIVRHADDGVGVAFLEPEASFKAAVEEILQSAPVKRVTPRP
ncbi:MAG: PilZ domain-containing protein [Deltaproteobacteria bacterium]|nr:PilZ domain-containing protein [Deltaproteobacteria bacterium]